MPKNLIWCILARRMRYIFLGFLLMLLSSGAVFAENSSVTVNQETKGTTTTCINGKCETTKAESYSKVCVNGECFESKDGNVDIDRGNTKVKINSSTGSNSVSVKSNESSNSVNINSSTSGDSEEKEDDKATESAQKTKEEVAVRTQETKRFIDTLIELLKNLLPFF